MIEFFLENYLLLKAIHLIAVISWMAGLLYMPRLFVYHCKAKQGSELDKTLQIMEIKLMRVIMTPAMLVVFLAGGILVYTQGLAALSGWFHAKMLFVLILLVLHAMMMKFRENFADGINTKSEKYFRIFNEAPTVCMVLIVLLTVIQPF